MNETSDVLVQIINKPTVILLAEMSFDVAGLSEMLDWVQENCKGTNCREIEDLWGPNRGMLHSNGELHSENELLVELAGRKCYNSFGEKAGRASNAAYTARLHGQPGKIPHSSVFYHAKMSFFVAGISRRVSLELIRHYVGADRELEGSPSQESTRYTHHNGHFCMHPRDEDGGIDAQEAFREDMANSYRQYLRYLNDQVEAHQRAHGEVPKGMDRKRIFECAAGRLPQQAATSLVWTTNPAALAKLFRERCDDASDLEFQRLAKAWREIAYKKWPNLFRDSNPAC